MTRLFLTMLTVIFISISVSGCESDLTPEEQNQLRRDFKRNLQPQR